jgi:hypothetical protein
MKPENVVKIRKFQKSVQKNMYAIQTYLEIPDKIANL